jgi:glycosyltransferase involved in cell wall biosynthesis
MTDIAICIATYRRPAGLQRLLESFDRLDYSGGVIEIFIADNDEQDHGGFDYVEANRAQHRHKLHCAIEPRPGISFARNRSLSLVRQSGRQFSYIAFTDDDIAVSRSWLDDLVRTARIYNAQVVFGKREPRFEAVPTPAILNSIFFTDEFQCAVTGTEVTEGSTCNMLADTAVFKAIGYEPFDTKLALSGGEDIDVCIQMKTKGFRFVTCACAVCYEFFPVLRLNETWITSRYFRTGSTYAYMQKKYGSRLSFYVSVLKKTLILPKLYLTFLLRRNLSAQCRLYNTLGFFFFLIKGTSFQEYGRKI